MTADPVILAFDTSAAHCAAAVLSGGQVLTAEYLQMEHGQGEHLFGVLEGALDRAGVGWSDLTLLGVGIGPGNFTGIRISVSAARGLSMSLAIPAIGVSALKAQAWGTGGVVVSTLDARRDNFYLQVIGGGETTDPMLCTLDALPPVPARAEPTCIGHAAAKVAREVAGHVSAPVAPLAEAIAHIAAARRYSTKVPPVPLYIRPPDAAPPRDQAPPALGG